MINEVITSLAEYPNMGSEAIFESTADVPEHATLDAPRYAVEPRIEIRKLSVYGLPTTPASEKSTEPKAVRRRGVSLPRTSSTRLHGLTDAGTAAHIVPRSHIQIKVVRCRNRTVSRGKGNRV
jgi:hypothetical protein